MRLAISIASPSSETRLDPRFGRAGAFLLVDIDTDSRRAVPNPAVDASGGAGVKAAEFVIQQGARVAISGSFGPKAAEVLAMAGVILCVAEVDTVDELLRHYHTGQLKRFEIANVPDKHRGHR